MWPHCITVLAGLWLMVAPAVLDLPQLPSNHDRIAGPVVAAFGTIAFSEVSRGVRWGAFVLGLWLIAAPFALGYWRTAPSAAVNDALCGGAIAAVSVFRGRVKQQYGGGWRELWRG